LLLIPTPEKLLTIRGYAPVIMVTVGKNQQIPIFSLRGVSSSDTITERTDVPKNIIVVVIAAARGEENKL